MQNLQSMQCPPCVAVAKRVAWGETQGLRTAVLALRGRGENAGVLSVRGVRIARGRRGCEVARHAPSPFIPCALLRVCASAFASSAVFGFCVFVSTCWMLLTWKLESVDGCKFVGRIFILFSGFFVLVGFVVGLFKLDFFSFLPRS